MARTLTPTTQTMLGQLPPWATNDPDIQGAVLAMSNEVDRINAQIADVVQGFFPFIADRYLYLWEATMGLGAAVDLTVPQRQARVLAFLQQELSKVPGATWVNLVQALLGPTFTWERPPTAPAHTITIDVPFAADSPQVNDLTALLNMITPANTVIAYRFGQGFIVQSPGSLIQSQPL